MVKPTNQLHADTKVISGQLESLTKSKEKTSQETKRLSAELNQSLGAEGAHQWPRTNSALLLEVTSKLSQASAHLDKLPNPLNKNCRPRLVRTKSFKIKKNQDLAV